MSKSSVRGRLPWNMFGRQGEISHRSAASRQDHERDALFAAAERKELAAQKFEEWVRFKDSFDRGLALFAKLDPGHCEVSEPHRGIWRCLRPEERKI